MDRGVEFGNLSVFWTTLPTCSFGGSIIFTWGHLRLDLQLGLQALYFSVICYDLSELPTLQREKVSGYSQVFGRKMIFLISMKNSGNFKNIEPRIYLFSRIFPLIFLLIFHQLFSPTLV